MKIKIDETGCLEIERRGKMKKQWCPLTPEGASYCGDWCPLFNLEHKGNRTILKLCNNVSYEVKEVK